MGEKKDYLRKYHFHRYQAKPFRNPYFQREPRGKGGSVFNKSYLTMVLAAVGVIGFIYLIGFAKFWMIKDVRVDGLQFMPGTEVAELAEKQLSRHRYIIFPQRNKLFFSKGQLEDALDEAYSFEELEVGVEKRVLTIHVKERVSEVLWQSGSLAFYTDVSGTVIRELPPDDVSLLTFHDTTQPTLDGRVVEGPYPRLMYLHGLPLIENEQADEVHPGDHVLSAAGIAGIIEINNLLQERGLIIERYVVERTDSVWARAEASEGFDVLFDAEGDIAAQVGYLTAVLTEDVPDHSKLDYVDVRFGNHVYFKNK